MELVNPPNTFDKALDLFVYAPIGAVLHLSKQVDGLAEQGRQAAQGRMGLYRTIGEFAVRQAQERNDSQRGALSQWLKDLALYIDQKSGDIDHRSGDIDHRSGDIDSADQSFGESAPQSEPVAGYDELTAAEIVKLLRHLPVVDLPILRRYELDHKGRRTVIARVDQLVDQSQNGS